MTSGEARFSARVIAAASTATVLFVGAIGLRLGGTDTTRYVADLGELMAAAVAAAACWRRSRRLEGRARRSWSLLAAACAAWTAGQAMWSWYELVDGREIPFPSLADAGFLGFPVLALAALLVRPTPVFHGRGRVRVALDAVLTVVSLFTLSWATVLGDVFRAGGDTAWSTAISLAYPASDVVMLTVTVLIVTHSSTRGRACLTLIAAGLAALAVADSGFAYTTASGGYVAGAVIDGGWFLAFVLIVIASVVGEPSDEATKERAEIRGWLLVLPYLPAAAGLTGAWYAVRGYLQNEVAVVGVALIIAALVSRQLVALRDNQILLAAVRHQAFTDPLTGLANRALFGDRLEHALELHGRDLRPLSVVLIDLDEFKLVNDSLGHGAGDQLLLRVAERLRAATRAGDTVARLGGDEFAVLLEGEGDALEAAIAVLDSFRAVVHVESRELQIRASLGLVHIPAADSSTTSSEVMKRADVAMYAAKRRGRNQLVSYSADLEGADSTELDLRADLAQVVAAGELDVAFQPVVNLAREVVGFEALVRWQRDGRWIPPSSFLPAAERAGLLAAIDHHVVTRAVEHAAARRRTGQLVWVSVNLSVSALKEAGTVPRVLAAAAAVGLEPSALVVEIPEGAELDEPATSALHDLRRAGVRLAIDDFGVGYSALARVQAIPPDLLKIDQRFVAALAGEPASDDLVAGIIDLAHRVGATVIAEGVETEVQLAVLARLGCDAVQGFLLGRPQVLPRTRSDVPLPAPRAGTSTAARMS